MLKITLKTILIFMIIYLLLLDCVSTTIPHTARYSITEQDRIFNASFEETWSAVVSSISSLQWETEFLDKSSGVIKFRTSYIYSDILGSSINRVYHWPKEYEAEFSNLKRYLTEYSYSEIKIPGIPRFSRENLVIQIIKVSSSEMKIDIKYTIEAFSSSTGFQIVNSNGTLEYQILSNIRSLLR